MDECTKKMWNIYSMEYYSATKKEILSFVTIRMDLEVIRLNEISQKQKNITIVWLHLYVESEKKPKQMNTQNKNKRIDTESKLVVTRGEGSWGIREMSEGVVNFW